MMMPKMEKQSTYQTGEESTSRPRKRVLLDPTLAAKVTDPTLAAKAGLTPEQVQLAQDRGQLPDPTVETPSAAASGAAAASTSTASGEARAVRGTASETVTASGAKDVVPTHWHRTE
eukprot:585422-Amphidinium_carterae.1